ncbi:hypothetical protein GGI25_004905 [Coemansia spiralis]|uniref:Mid2 domain-containing protein n=2 Tax=Coemansia TaxID=4863 RepID=A0A9W8G488_9FUNG|nr:hypothetical protein BX070DRAFT_217865 [Coemansia spiralis]KAJ1990819.1 hypothetical protein EDC05_003799 [Coemansia umbellata]KAJ2622605.1 hypothetical protein GGI26_003051 [Coemansia sp. RSA 1358]KAJ2672924.1 hypothetical protein GGI25_004905 [Coemansia spiralis]
MRNYICLLLALLAIFSHSRAEAAELEDLYSIAPQAFQLRDVSGCPAGYTNCDMFGCVQNSTCPDVCSQRTSANCAFSMNGVGCKWMYNTCVQDIQCSVGASGECSEGCQGCGAFQCIVDGLQCPTPCTVRPQALCGTSMLYNGFGCAWIGNGCLTWDFINGAPVAYNEPEPSQGQLSTTTFTVTQTHTLTPTFTPKSSSTSSSTTSSTASTSISQHSTTSHSSTSLSSSDESSTEEPPLSDEHSESSSKSTSSQSESNESPDKTATKGTSVPVIIGIVILVIGLIGLISWGALYMLTKDKVNFNPPPRAVYTLAKNDGNQPPNFGDTYNYNGDWRD